MKRQTRGSDQRADDLAALPGADAAAAAAWLAAQEVDPAGSEAAAAAGPTWEPIDLSIPLAIWRCNAPALRLWLQLQTQWRWDTERRPLGLRYEALQAALWAAGLKPAARRQHFDEIVDMQHAALEAWDGV